MTEADKCPQCEADLPANFPPGVCPACLLRQGMSPSTLTGAAGEAGSGNIGSGNAGSGGRRHWIPPTPEDLAPRFPQLEIVQLLGQGGMGAVYKVRQKELDRWAALKILPDDVASDPSFAERFQREARTLAQLSHPHIVTVYEFGQRDGIFFLLMEFVDGVTLRQAIRAGLVATSSSIQSGLSGESLPQLTAVSQPVATPEPSRHISPMAALGIVGQICDALQFAHEEGVVHRDIKPENILIDKRGRVKIADFGLAKLLGRAANFPTLTDTHQVMGTPAYMAPEQMEGSRSIDHRADIFSLGVVFYELLTGELPLGRFAPPSQKYSLDVRLDEIVLRTLEKEPARRYQQASAVKHDVETLRSQTNHAGSSKTAQPRQSWLSSNIGLSIGKLTSLAVVVALSIFVGLVGTTFFISWLERQPTASVVLPERTVSGTISVPARLPDQLPAPLQPQEPERPAQLDKASSDPFEVNAIVRFTSDGVKLNPRAFNASELTPGQRTTLEKILTDIHQKYLKLEAANTEFTVDGETQLTTIGQFDTEIVTLENDLWTAIDTQLPISVQKLLRTHLPLYMPMPDWQITSFQGSFGSAMPAPGFGPPAGGGLAGGPIPGMMAGIGPDTPNPTWSRYPQLLGWGRSLLPLQISIGRRGKWFKWSLETYRTQSTPEQLDSGEAPELPSGLRRFWRDHVEIDPIVWTAESVQLSPQFVARAKLGNEQQKKINLLLNESAKKYNDLECSYFQWKNLDENGKELTSHTLIPDFSGERSELVKEFWQKMDAIVAGPQRELIVRELSLTHSSEAIGFPSILGWDAEMLPVEVELKVNATKAPALYRWNVIARGRKIAAGVGTEFPLKLARFWSVWNNNRLTPEAVFRLQHQALITRQWHTYTATFTEEGRDEFSLLMLLTCSGDKGADLIESANKTLPTLNLRSAELKSQLDAITLKFRQKPPSRAEFRAEATPFIRKVLGDQSRKFFRAVAEFRHPATESPGSKEEIEWGELMILSKQDNEARGSHIGLPGMPVAEGNPITFKRRNGQWEIDGVEEFPIILATWLAGESKPPEPSALQPETAK